MANMPTAAENAAAMDRIRENNQNSSGSGGMLGGGGGVVLFIILVIRLFSRCSGSKTTSTRTVAPARTTTLNTSANPLSSSLSAGSSYNTPASTSSYSSYTPPRAGSSYAPPTLGGSAGAKPKVFCTSCGHSNSGGSITCFSCSALLGGQPEPASSFITVSQPQGATELCACGTAYVGTSQFCTGCGQKRAASAPQAAATGSANICTGCGTAYTGSSQFCTGCGTKKAGPIAAAVAVESDLLRTQSGQPLVLAAAVAVDDVKAPQDPLGTLLVTAQLTQFEEALRELGKACTAFP